MPAAPGEQLLTTLFADIHYYFSDPTSKPSHHRFVKGSYVYVYFNPNNHQAKLEVANHAGTPDQDAFHGYLHVVNVAYNHLQPALLSLAVNTAIVDQSTWHLPSYDVRNEQKYLYKLHAVDLYFWTEKDAQTMMSHVKSVVSADRLSIKNSPAGSNHPEHRDSMSPVVQQLEKTAIGTAFPPRATSTVSANSLPGPPTPQSINTSPKVAPMTYNPAAPSAPEPVTYREKTPPPDDGTGTGLKAAQQYDSAPQQQYASTQPSYQQSSAQTTPQNAYFRGPPQQSQSSSMPPPPAQSPPTQTRTPSFGPLATSTIGPTSPPPQQTIFNRQSSFGPPPTQQHANYNPQSQFANYPGSPGFQHQGQQPPTPSAPPAYADHTPLNSPGMPPAPPQGPPQGGYAQYSYAAAGSVPSSHQNQHGAYTGDTHSQVYRPTEAEYNAHGKPKPAAAPGKASPLQEGVGKVEKKVGKFLGRLDKLY